MRMLITGGAGHVARIYRAHIGVAHQVRLLDRAPIAVLNVSSDNVSNRFDLRRARALIGYAPQDQVEDVLAMSDER